MRFYMRLRCDEPAQKPELEACASGNHALAKVFTDHIPSLAYFSIDGTQRRLPLATNQCIILNCLLHLAGYIDPFPCMQPLTAAILPNHDLLSKVLDDSIKMFAILSHCSQSVSQLTELALFSLLQRFLSLSTSQFEAQPASTLRARRLAFLVVRAKAELNTPRFVPLPRAPFPASTTHYSSFRDIIAHLRLRIRAIFYDRRRYTSYCFPGLAGRDQFLAVLL